MLWEMQESADLIGCTESKEREAIAAIEEFTMSHADAYCGVSWGKDSVTTAHLLWKVARDIPLVHLRPTNHNHDCDNVRDRYFESFPGQEYREVLVDYSGVDRCRLTDQEVDEETDRIWYESISTIGDASSGRILGIRADESIVRTYRVFRWGLNTKNACAPIGKWTTNDVFCYLAKNDLPVHPVYAMNGGGRWNRERLRVAEIGDIHGTGGGRRQWEQEYYGDVLARMQVR